MPICWTTIQQKTNRSPLEMLGINVEGPKFPQFAIISKRLESFDTWPEYLPVAVKDLVEAGLVYTGVGDSVRCYHCGGGLRNWEPEDDPMKEHAKWYPNCPHLMLVKGKAYIEKVRSGEPILETDHFDSGIQSKSQVSRLSDCIAAQSCLEMAYPQDMVKKKIAADKQQLEMLGINVERPKFPQFAIVSKRLESFDTWPEYLPVAVKDLVEAGLVYTGVGDSVRCYHCGGCLRNWEPEGDPMKEHAKCYPNCIYRALVKAKKWCHKKLRRRKPNSGTKYLDSEIKSIQVSQVSEPSSYLDIPAAQSCLDMGYSQDMVKKAIIAYKQQRGNYDFKAIELYELLLAMGDRLEEFPGSNFTDNDSNGIEEEVKDLEPIVKLMEESERLKCGTWCKLCLDHRADVICFLCGHMVVCPLCAPTVTKCRIC